MEYNIRVYKPELKQEEGKINIQNIGIVFGKSFNVSNFLSHSEV